jgi:hypothetical protein
MVASWDACPLCDKPFCGKHKFVRCDACEIQIHCVCLQLGEVEQATVTETGESVYKCNACAKSLGSSSNDKALPKSMESLSHHEGATSCTSPNEEASSLIISVSTQFEAVRHNGQCTIQLVESIVDMATNLTREFTHLKNGIVLLRQEINNLHSLIHASPKPTSQYITREQRILLAEMSHKEAASIQHVSSAALPTQALPAISIPAGMTLLYRDVTVAGISPS